MFLYLTSSEMFTARTWFAVVTTRPLEMSFSMVSWDREGGGLRLGTSHIPWGTPSPDQVIHSYRLGPQAVSSVL